MDYRYVIKRRNNNTKKRVKIRVNFTKIAFVFLFLSLTFGIYYSYRFLEKKIACSFTIKKIELIGNKNASSKSIEGYLKKFRGKSLVNLNMKKIFDNIIANYPWVKDVVVHKSYPHELVVEIIEEKPIGVINCNDKFYIVTGTGKIIKNFDKKLLASGNIIFTLKNFNDFPKVKDIILKIYGNLQKIKLKNVSEVVINNDIKIFTFKPYRKYIVDIASMDENLMKIKELKNNILKINNNFKEVNLKYKDKIFIKL